MTDPSAAQNIYKFDPRAKIIIVLRNPADRAYSLYSWMVQEGYEHISSFEKALKAEGARLKKQIPNFWEPQYFHNYMYFHSGLYAEQVKRYLDLFKDNVLVLSFEELLQDIKNGYTTVRSFLGIAPHPDRTHVSNPSYCVYHPWIQFWLRKWNEHSLRRHRVRYTTKEERDELMLKGIRRKKTPPMRAETRAALLERYRDDVRRTAQLANKDLEYWLSSNKQTA
jgi:hypothetical protein